MKAMLAAKQSSIELHTAILLYGNRRNGSIEYASRHDIQMAGGHPQILSGSPLSTGALSHAYESLMGGLLPLDLMDHRILAFNGQTMVFWVMPKPRHVFFECPEPMGKRSGMVHNPGLIFVASRQGLQVLAVKGCAKPKANTSLFLAPYLNIYADGNVCMGNVPLPEPRPSSVDLWIEAFFHSRFTHANGAVNVQYTGGIYSLWNDLLDNKVDRFPEDALIPLRAGQKTDKATGITLAQFLNTL